LTSPNPVHRDAFGNRDSDVSGAGGDGVGALTAGDIDGDIDSSTNELTNTSSSGARRKLMLTLLDQCVSSGSNFATGLVVVTLLNREGFGAYSLALSVWLFSVGLHRAMVTEPTMLLGHRADSSFVRRGVAAELLIAACLSTISALAGAGLIVAGSSGDSRATQVGWGLVVLAVAIPPMLLQDYWRGIAFHVGRPDLALVNDSIFAAIQLTVLAVMWWRDAASVPIALSAWGLGAAGGSLFAWRRFGAVASGAVATLRITWGQGRWLLADFVSTFCADQAYLLAAAALLREADYGGARSAFVLIGPVVVIMIAGGNIGLPMATRRYQADGDAGLRAAARQLSLAVGGAVTLYGIAVFALAPMLLRALNVDEADSYVGVARLAALQYVVVASVFGLNVAVKVTHRSRALWKIRLVVAAVTVAAIIPLTNAFGVNGVGWAAVLSGIGFAVGIVYAWRHEPARTSLPA
jgi:O-antigen/teichoic acid export membrane protein